MTMSSLLLYFADQKTWILAQFLYVFYQVPVAQRVDSVRNSIGFDSCVHPLKTGPRLRASILYCDVTRTSLDHVTAIKSEGWALGNMNSSYRIILAMGLLPYLNKSSNFSRGKIRIVEIDSVVTNQQ